LQRNAVQMYESSELRSLYFILLCVNGVFITIFGSLLCCKNLLDFIIILEQPFST